MSLYYQLVFAMLVLEMAVFTLLVLPLPLSVRKSVLTWFSKSKLVAQVQSILRILFVLVVILFVDALNKIRSAQKHDEEGHGHMHDARTDSYLHAKKFYAQRNVYLCGSVIFLSLVLNRFYKLMLELLKNEEKTEVLKSQAAKTSKEYLKLLDADQVKQKQIDDLKKEVEKAKKSVTELEIVKKQAQQSHDEYMRLTDRYNELEKKLQGREKEDSKSK